MIADGEGFILDLKEEVKGSDDFGLLDVYLRPLVGQRVIKARLSYGDELHMHFGSILAIHQSAMPSRGQWVLTARGSAWWASIPELAVEVAAGRWWPAPWPVKPASAEKVVSYLDKMAGMDVRDIWPFRALDPKRYPPGFRMSLGDGSVFELLPNPADDPDGGSDAIADWELFTPWHTYIRVGPGPVWSNLRSDVALAAG